MNITSSIYILIAVSFCTASANESSVPREKGNLATRVKINTKNIDVMERKILKSKAKLNKVVVEFSGTVMDVNENIADLAVRIQNTTEDVNGAVLEIDGKVNDSNQVIADLGRQIKKTAEELNGDVLRLDEKITNADVGVEGKFVELNEEIADIGGQLNATTDDLNDLDGAVTGVEEKIEVLNGDVLELDEKFTNADVDVEGKVTKLNEEIADLGGKLNTTTDDLNDIDEVVTGLEEKYDGAVTSLEEKIELLEEALEVSHNDLDEAVTGLEEKHDGAVTGLEEKIKLLEDALEVALKVEEIQFRGVASQSTTYPSSNYTNYDARNCNDGAKNVREKCHTNQGDADPWWKLSFTNDVVINRIVLYVDNARQYTAGNRLSILSTTGTIVWEHTIEKEEKRIYVIAVPNVAGQYVKIDKAVNGYIIMSEMVVFGRYD